MKKTSTPATRTQIINTGELGKQATVKDLAIMQAFEKYERLAKKFERDRSFRSTILIEDRVKLADFEAILNPTQVNLFASQLFCAYSKPEARIFNNGRTMGIYLSILMQASNRELNEKNFELHIPRADISCLGNLNKDLSVRVVGNAGNFFGNLAYKCEFIVDGNTGDLAAAGALECSFDFYGSLGIYAGQNAKQCEFTLPKEKYEVHNQPYLEKYNGNKLVLI